MSTRLTTTAVVAVAALVGVAAALVLGPRPLTLDDPTGDRALAARAAEALGDRGHEQVAVALVDGDRVSHAGFGADERTPFEIGSVTKVLTGMLLADLARDGEVRLDQPVGELVPGTELEGARATLQELSQHRSGLRSVPLQPGPLARNAVSRITGGDPYTGTSDDVLALAADEGADGGAEPSYSNLGVSTLGDALARQLATPYPELVSSRILEPLGMRDTTIVTRDDELPRNRATGRAAGTGLARDPWIAAGWTPAGIGSWSTTADLVTLSRGLLDGSAPGASAVEPTRDYTDGRRIGLGWITSDEGGRAVTWHNGGTGGFHTFVGLDRERNRAVVVLSASTEPVDEAGIELLTGEDS